MEAQNLITYLRLQKHTQNTIKSYTFIIDRYLKQHPDACQYGYKEIMDYFKQRLLNGKNRSGVILLQAGIKKYYDYLLHTGIIYYHPCRNICIKKRNKNIVHRDLFTNQELSLLLKREERYAVLKYRNKLLISLLIYQGLTLAEVIQLKTTDIDLDEATINIRASVTINKRVLNLKPRQLILFDKYLRLSRNKLIKTDTNALLLNKLGNPIKADDVQYLVETFRYLFPDRKLNLQTIRQSVIANWLNSYQIPLEDVQLLAGHKRPSATLKYQLPNMQQAVNTLNAHFPI
jgi:site-specific recombinase XerD